ncbi:hypothetical protein RUM44_005223 [Polyplax serrata]|uniref:Uncharacterized protein n=1 Tax=Polyplax serrata TaxID=468196 RepID=A0ABR1AEE5_POLSC
MIFSQDREGCFLLSAHLKLNKSRVFLGLPFIQPGGVKTTISITWVGETKAKGGFESCRKSAIDGRPEATNEGWQKRQRKTCRAVNESKHDVDYSQKMDGRTDSVSQRLRTKLTRSSHVRHLIQVNMLYAFA